MRFYRNYLISGVIFVVFVSISIILNKSKNDHFSSDVIYTVGEIKSYSKFRLSVIFQYEFKVNGEIKKSEDVVAWFDDIERYKKYIVAISGENQEYSKLMIEHPLSDSTKAPDKFWKEFPVQLIQ